MLCVNLNPHVSWLLVAEGIIFPRIAFPSALGCRFGWCLEFLDADLGSGLFLPISEPNRIHCWWLVIDLVGSLEQVCALQEIGEGAITRLLPILSVRRISTKL